MTFLCYEESEEERLHSDFGVLDTRTHTRFSDDLTIHLIELPKLGRMEPQETDEEAKLIPWAKFFTASSDEQFKEAAQGDQKVEKAMDYLEQLSAKADVRLLAERREMAWQMCEMEQEMARLKGKAEGIVEGKRDDLLRVLHRRGIGLTEVQRTKIDSCAEIPLLEQ